jgi:chromosome segregation protein
MKLKSLEISGFKSFADKTTIEFMPGMTGIVGPNGSGKSNIIEAMRWVMGEQSAKDLRGSKMSDVIFAGTGARGALSRAEVSMTFDNSDRYIHSDFNEIRITRKLYRNGETQYLINGVTSRLRDIHELFMDTGLGRESFSIISQGRVESIFNAKAEDRRAIVEEVAGVFQYKQHKEKAQKELQATDDNLARVADIIYEIEGRLEPLAQQSAQATDYLAQKARFDTLNQTYLAGKYQQVMVDKQAVTQDLSQQEATLGQLSEQLQAIQSDLHKGEAALAEQTALREALQEQLVELTAKQERLSGQQQLDVAQAQNVTAQLEEIEAQLAQLTQRINEQRQQVTTLQTAAQRAQEAFDAADALKKAHDGHSLAEQQTAIQAQLDKTRASYVDLLQREARQQNMLQTAEKQQAQLTARLAHLQERQSQQAAQIQSEKAQVANAKAALNTAGEQQNDAQLAQLDEQIKAQQTHYQTAQQDWYDALAVLNKLQSRLSALQAMDDYAGYYQGVRHLMQHQAQFNGIEGVVAELLQVPTKYTLAIETALGGALQQVVVQTTQTAKDAVSYLTKNRAGRVTFLPVDTIKPRHLATQQLQAAEQVPGFIGVATQLVQMPAHLKNIQDYLLGHTFIAENLSAATQLAKVTQYRVRVVSLDGQIVNAGGSITGGAHKTTNATLLSRQAEVADLTQAVEKAEKQAQQLEHNLQTIQAKGQALTKQYQHLKEQVHAHEGEQQQLHLALRQAEQDLAQQERQGQVLQLEEEALRQEADDLTANIQDYQREIEALSQQHAQLEAKQTQLQTQLATVTQQQQQSAVDLVAVQSQFVAADNERQYAQERLQQAQGRLAESQQQLEALQYKQEQLKQQQQNQPTAQEVQEALATVQQALADVQTSLTQQQNTVQQTQVEQQTRHQQIEQYRQEQSQLLRQANSLSAQQARLQTQSEQIVEELRDIYGVDAQDVKVEQTINLADLHDQIKLLQRGLDELGDVNVGAIQEYDDVKTRYDFLTQQRTDLQEAKVTLLATIDEMDSEVAQRFKTTFDAIASHFGQIFTQMFGGGQAEIRLTDPENLLTTGIDIIAQPPGKKFQQMSLLSGGEKALTAITLLFAILQVRPVPFVVLDEAEAALDEANVDRFATYLHDFSGTTQFIVITHRKGTMVNANLLYGVTMQEAGVSKMVAVDIDQLSDEAS